MAGLYGSQKVRNNFLFSLTLNAYILYLFIYNFCGCVITLKDEFVTSLAALALYDGDAEITSDNIKALITASNNTVAPYWPALFASFLKGGRIESLVFSAGSGGGGAAAPAAAGDATPGIYIKLFLVIFDYLFNYISYLFIDLFIDLCIY